MKARIFLEVKRRHEDEKKPDYKDAEVVVDLAVAVVLVEMKIQGC